MREPGAPGVLHLLADFDDFFRCNCEACFAVILRFSLSGGGAPSATLTSITLIDFFAPETTAERLAAEIDFANGPDMLWNRDAAGYPARVAALVAEPPAERAARLYAALRVRLDPGDGRLACFEHGSVRGPMRCEGCGDVRKRRHSTALVQEDPSHSFFGLAWPANGLAWPADELRPGMRIEGDLPWLAEDVDRGLYLRVRHPIPPGRLSLISGVCSWGCPCGAGQASVVLHFAVAEGGVTLEEITLRVVSSREDLDDIERVRDHARELQAADAGPVLLMPVLGLADPCPPCREAPQDRPVRRRRVGLAADLGEWPNRGPLPARFAALADAHRARALPGDPRRRAELGSARNGAAAGARDTRSSSSLVD